MSYLYSCDPCGREFIVSVIKDGQEIVGEPTTATQCIGYEGKTKKPFFCPYCGEKKGVNFVREL